MQKKYSPESRDYSKYDAMSTQELERILDQYFLFPDEVKDKDLMVHIMEVLTERDSEVIDANNSNPNAFWDDFLKAHPNIVSTSSKSVNITTVLARRKAMSRRALRRAAGIAAVLVCVLLGGTVTAYAAGIDVFHAIAHWTDDTFCFRPATAESEENQIREQFEHIEETSGYISKNGNGKIEIHFRVLAEGRMAVLGASSIAICKSNGSYITTLSSADYDNMLSSNTAICSSSVSYSAESGQTYYAVITFYADSGSAISTTTYTTASVTA